MECITFSRATQQYFEACRAARFSDNTLKDYRNTYKRFIKFLDDDPPITSLTSATIVRFMSTVSDVSKKTALNYHTGLSALWHWGVDQGILTQNVVRQVKAPKPEKREIIPFSRAEVTRILQACGTGLSPLRDRAIILTLLDTGMRASEICALQLQDMDFEGHSIIAFGKGDKERVLKFCERTNEFIQAYLAQRRIGKQCKKVPLFTTVKEKTMNRQTLRLMLDRLETRSGVVHVHAHRFRHTFAINFLRNGGNIYTLQKLLGHTAFDMVKRYLAIAETDLDHDHQKASPVKAWGL